MTDETLDRALAAAYRFLGRRDRSVAEMRRHLLAKDIREEVVEAVIVELAGQGYLDDARYAERLAEDRRRLDGWGSERIARKLADAGVAREHIDRALSGAGEEELETALGLLRRRFTAPPADDRARDRALGFLVRKGYELDLAYDAVRAFR